MRYFKEKEFTCKCGCGDAKMDVEFLRKLDEARYQAGIPFVISSGKRCEAHNKAVGGVPSSAHTKGLAVDIRASTSLSRFLVVKALLDVGFTRIGIGSSFVHADADDSLPQEVMWDY